MFDYVARSVPASFAFFEEVNWPVPANRGAETYASLPLNDGKAEHLPDICK